MLSLCHFTSNFMPKKNHFLKTFGQDTKIVLICSVCDLMHGTGSHASKTCATENRLEKWMGFFYAKEG